MTSTISLWNYGSPTTEKPGDLKSLVYYRQALADAMSLCLLSLTAISTRSIDSNFCGSCSRSSRARLTQSQTLPESSDSANRRDDIARYLLNRPQIRQMRVARYLGCVPLNACNALESFHPCLSNVKQGQCSRTLNRTQPSQSIVMRSERNENILYSLTYVHISR